MGKSAKPRKSYKPIPRRGNLPIVYGISPEIKAELAIAPFMAISLFASGHASEELAYTIINSILIGYELAKDELDRQRLICGSEAMKSVLYRGAQGRWGFSGQELKDVTVAIALSDKLQDMATRREMRRALQAVFENAYDT
jgi:hypothetical protein